MQVSRHRTRDFVRVAVTGIRIARSGRERLFVRSYAVQTTACGALLSPTLRSIVQLADFIAQHSEPILLEWEAFAKSCGIVGDAMDRGALRDHAARMLTDIVADLRTSQSPAEQEAKSKGASNPDGAAPDTAAEEHGAGRAESGFTMSQMVAEYRALRASVVRLWTVDTGTLTGTDLRDLMRFNEAIDQALAESVSRFSSDLDRSREMFVAVLGHDLRNPLNTILMGAQFLLQAGALAEPHASMTQRIVRAAKRMQAMTEDLLGLAMVRLGGGLPILRQPSDFAEEAVHAIAEIEVAHPGHAVQLITNGELHGQWDGARLRQLLSNLLGNAVQHGDKYGIIRVMLSGTEDHVTLAVHNTGPPIPTADLPHLFHPFKRVVSDGAPVPQATSAGLGLFIAEQIVHAHGGTIVVTSSERDGTVFTVSLPRDAAVAVEPDVAKPDPAPSSQPRPIGAR